MTPYIPFQLTNTEVDSHLWLKLQEQINRNINTLRMQNDSDKDPIETAKLRGQIAAYKTILNYNPKAMDGNALVGE